jgi:hypothetical protein
MAGTQREKSSNDRMTTRYDDFTAKVGRLNGVTVAAQSLFLSIL